MDLNTNKFDIDPDLAQFIKEMADHNGISPTKYLNNLLEQAVNNERKPAKPVAIPIGAMEPPYHLQRIRDELYIENNKGLICDMQLSEGADTIEAKAAIVATAQFIVNACNAARVEPI